MSELLGTARVDVEVNTDPLVAGINRAKHAMSEMSAAAQLEGQKSTAVDKRRIASLQNRIAVLGLTKQEELAYQIVTKTSGKVQEELLHNLNRSTLALRNQGIQFNEYGRSVKQTTAAMRQVPAQMTDIFVSLQGGQNPLTVLLQQGGQLKDVFGGIRPAASALGSALLRLINPYTLLAAAIGTVGVAWFQSQKEGENFAKALILTGNYAGVTVGQMDELAASLAHVTGSQGDAAEALSKVAGTGKFTAGQLELVSEAALEMQHATGAALDDTIAQFAKLADDPVKGLVELNKTMHFLTEATYEQVKALVEQGRQEEAVTLAVRTASGAMTTRAQEVVANVNTMAGAWLQLKGIVKQAWSEMVHAELITSEIGKAQTNLQHANQTLLNISKELNSRIADGTADKATVARLRARIDEMVQLKRKSALVLTQPDPAAESAAKEAIRQKANDFAIAVDQEADLHLSAETRRVKLLNRQKAEADAQILAAEKIGDRKLADTIRKNMAELQKNIEAENAKKPKKTGAGEARALENAQARAALQAFKDNLLEEQAAIESSNRVLQAKYQARLITAEEYYSEQRKLAERGSKAQETALLGEISALQQRDVKGKISVDNLRQIGQLEAQLVKVREESASKLEVLSIQEQEYYEQRSKAIRSYKNSLDDATNALSRQIELSVASVGMGAREIAEQEAVNRIYEEQADKLRDLSRALEDHAIDQTRYDEEVKLRQEATDRQIAIVQNGFEQMKEAEADWRNGLRRGLADWIAQTGDVASQIADITTSSLDRAADALTEFATTGALDIKKMLADILTELVKFFAKQAVLNFAKMFLGGITGFGPGTGATGFGTKTFAAGDSFSGGTTLPSNTILTKPTLFKFAKGGAFGVGGEAGPEAVMPLSRGADGKLGVRVNGNVAAASMVQLNVNTVVNADGSSSTTSEGEQDGAYSKFVDIMGQVCKRTIEEQLRPGGSLYRARVGAAA